MFVGPRVSIVTVIYSRVITTKLYLQYTGWHPLRNIGHFVSKINVNFMFIHVYLYVILLNKYSILQYIVVY